MTAEAIVALTDFALALECAAFALALWLRRGEWTRLRAHFLLFFAFSAIASLTGGAWHAWYADGEGPAANALWKATMVAIGVSAFSAWAVAAEFFAPRTRRAVLFLASLDLVAYIAYVLVRDDRFGVAVVNYAPAAAFLALTFAWAWLRRGDRAVRAGLFGLVVMGVAALGQGAGFALHRESFNHNATYHLVQAIGLALLFASTKMEAMPRAR